MIDNIISDFNSLRSNNFFHVFNTNKKDYYISHVIPKSDGSKRYIDAPQDPLIGTQYDILHKFLYKFKPHQTAVGFISGMGVEEGAKRHLPNNVVLNMDIKDFFPSVKRRRVLQTLSFLMRRANKTKLFSERVYPDEIQMIGELLTYKGSLPQGAPTSPAAANLVAFGLDKKLYDLACQYGMTYTRYADDLSFSHPDEDFSMEDMVAIVDIIIRSEGFTPNKKKTRISRPHQRMQVTGIVINEKLSVPRWKWRNFRAKLHNLKMDGHPISEQQYQKLKGYCEWIKNLHPKRGKKFLSQLGQIPRASSSN